MYKVDNAVILAAGLSRRFAPLSHEKPKSLIEVKGEILIERQIRQIKEAGISDIYIVTGYKSEQFKYLEKKFGVKLIFNSEYSVRNNHSSIYVAREHIKNTYICSGDNYFSINPFEKEVKDSYYATLYSDDYTKEWCVKLDDNGHINEVSISGSKSWYMIGHTFWGDNFSREFIKILEEVYENPGTKDLLWEDIYRANLNRLKMGIRKYDDGDIYEFDSLDELRKFDHTYIDETRSEIIHEISERLSIKEGKMFDFMEVKEKTGDEPIGFKFRIKNDKTRTWYYYDYEDKNLIKEKTTII